VKRAILAAAAIGAAVAVWIRLVLPEPMAALEVPNTPDAATLVRGVFHVHTNRSDGRSAPEVIAAAAARAGVKFVIFTDHGDGTRKPSPPVYHGEVLCIDGVEISTQHGHYAVIDLPQTPYPLGGEARDVIADVQRMGGFGVAAHPDSPKDDLRWREWDEPFDAIELLNLDSGWRTWVQQGGWRATFGLISALATYPFRPAETIAGLMGESTAAQERWESLTRRRRIVALAGADAHAKLAITDVDPGDNRFSLPLPGYEASFRTTTVHVRTDRPLSGDAAADAQVISSAIRSGHLYAALSGIASPAYLEFSAENDRGTARAGDELPAGGPVTLRVRTNAPAGFPVSVWSAQQRIAEKSGEPEFTIQVAPEPAVYRVEIRASGDSAPVWAFSNPIYVRGSEPSIDPPTRPPPTDARILFDARDPAAWQVETDPTSLAATDVVRGTTGPELMVRFGLATGPPLHQYAAVAVATPDGIAAYDRLTFGIRSERPMRVSVQLRAVLDGNRQERWQRSVYVDPTGREMSVFFDDVSPVGSTGTFSPPLAAVRGIVFAVDLTNTKPGTAGRVWLRDVRLEK
jgi:hypothetical protein